MKVAVCLKRVPDTTTKIEVGADGKSINPAGVQYVISPYDEFAVEEGIRRKEAAGEGSVTIVTVGPAASTDVIRKALGMGADDAVLATNEESLDPRRTAEALAGVLRDRGDDLVLFGRTSVDGQSAQVGAQVAGLLGIPYVGGCGRPRDRRPLGEDHPRGRGWACRAPRRPPPRHRLPEGAERAALPLSQGDHDGEEEADRDRGGHLR